MERPVAETPASDGDGHRALARNHTVDAVAALVLLGIGIVVVVQALELGATWTSDGPGSGYFPFYIGVILCISSLGIFYQAVFSAARDRRAFVDRVQLARVASVLLPAIVYVFCIGYLGLYVASALYIALFMIVLGKYPKLRSVLVAVIINALFFAMFEIWFKVPLYKGSLDPLGFLGY